MSDADINHIRESREYFREKLSKLFDSLTERKTPLQPNERLQHLDEVTTLQGKLQK